MARCSQRPWGAAREVENERVRQSGRESTHVESTGIVKVFYTILLTLRMFVIGWL